MAGRRHLDLSLSKVRSAITNGSAVLNDVDGRSATMRRFRDIIHAHTADLGGEPVLSEGQKALLLRRAALLQLQLEMQERKFAVRDDGVATSVEIEVYQRASGALRRLLESLGLHAPADRLHVAAPERPEIVARAAFGVAIVLHPNAIRGIPGLEYRNMGRNSPNTGHWRGHGPRMAVCLLPDGRRLVAEDQAIKISDADGDEIESTPDEVAALMAICGVR